MKRGHTPGDGIVGTQEEDKGKKNKSTTHNSMDASDRSILVFPRFFSLVLFSIFNSVMTHDT